MKKPFQVGDLVILIKSEEPLLKQFIGQIHRLGGRCPFRKDAWDMNPPLFAKDGRESVWHETHMRRIDDNPGNEHWVTEARKQLTGGKTETTERGELRV